MATNVTTHVIQCETDEEYAAAVAQLDAYTAEGREPPLLSRADDMAQRSITFAQETALSFET